MRWKKREQHVKAGDVIISPPWTLNAASVLCRVLQSHKDLHFVHVRQGGLYWVATTTANSSPFTVIEFLNRFVITFSPAHTVFSPSHSKRRLSANSSVMLSDRHVEGACSDFQKYNVIVLVFKYLPHKTRRGIQEDLRWINGFVNLF